ncbi:3-oxoacyl-ACP reductase [Bacillus paralicheniformis]|nr:SDR family oxidoreductase [Bacillus paralicheniformis]MSO02956.1 SDR family oxidoreductase [Bacillus paralicheniformis]MSO06949.1 SDR family oxidoreductase [Bacillus paralicheniformis]MSO10943.1 SDR family oxidoreductase [Bacillus paralicheniformis]NJE35971.1 3-oxoacyl-ACP reductase FabG [Bacillus paralicheniformis]
MNRRNKNLMGKVALITGGTRGIGYEILKKFAHDNIVCYFTYVSSDDFANKIESEYKNAFGIKADVRNYSIAKRIIQNIYEKEGKLDILINNAGINQDKTIRFMNEKSWKKVIDTNLTGTFNYSKFASQVMKKNDGGCIINISSVSSLKSITGQTNYSASKAGINSLTKTFAHELASDNIRVNAIVPGYIDTEMVDSLNLEEIIKTIPLKRLGTGSEIASIVNYLISEEAGYITGQLFVIDGGLTL